MNEEEMDFDDDFDAEPFVTKAKGSEIPKALQAPKYTYTATSPKRRLQGFSTLRNSSERMKFVIEDILPDTGLLYWAGESASGKTILAIQSAIDMVMRRNTLRWKFNEEIRQQKILFLSLEMNSFEVTERINAMYPKMSKDDDDFLEEHFQVYSDFEPFNMWNTLHVAELNHIVKEGRFTGILIDSASVSFADQPNNAEQINTSIKNLYGMRAERGIWNSVIVHTRKPDGKANKKPGEGTMHDIMGHSGFAQSASTIMLLEPHPFDDTKPGAARKIEITNAKNRYGLSGSDIRFPAIIPSKKSVVEDGIPLHFMANVPHVLPPLPKPRPGEKKPNGIFSGLNLGNFKLEEDEL